MQKILVIDDEPVIQHAFRKAFHAPAYETLTVRTAAEGLERLRIWRPDVLVLDVHLPDSDGLQTFDRAHEFDARLPIILITGHGTTELAIEAMKRGAFDYLLKPLSYDQLRETIDRAGASNRLMTVPALVGDESESMQGGDALIGHCPAMQEIYKAIGRVAATDSTVLVLGESGTGKELVARAIYQHSRRAEKTFLAINCGAIPESLVESELFGHEKGAFTGADRKRIGKFEQCIGGTLFLDEVAEMPLLAQVKLLRVLQEQRFERVGGTETVQTDVRIIAATNADLEKQVAAGRFRADLFFRLNVFTIRLPALRERGDDIDLLTDYFLRRGSAELGRAMPIVPANTRAVLRAHSWPGNIRELQSVLKQAMLQMSGAVLLPDFLSIGTKAGATAPTGIASTRMEDESQLLDWNSFVGERLASGSCEIYAECLRAMERQVLIRVLAHTGGNQLRAAELLGITRNTLRSKLRSLDIPSERSARADET